MAKNSPVNGKMPAAGGVVSPEKHSSPHMKGAKPTHGGVNLSAGHNKMAKGAKIEAKSEKHSRNQG